MTHSVRIPWRSAVAAVLLAATGVIVLPGEAAAHRLKLFVTAEAGEISGHAFFVGGGRPEGVEVVVKEAGGREVHRGRTDAQGGFRWRPTTAVDHTIAVDAGDGHRIEATITADRLVGATPLAAAGGETTIPAAANGPAAATVDAVATSCPAGLDPGALARLVESRVDAAVARQMRPLLEAYGEAESRLRFNDVMGGIGMIAGLAGAGLWATARRRREGRDTP